MSSSSNSNDGERKRENVQRGDDDDVEDDVEGALAAAAGGGNGKYVRYTGEQVQALEKLYCECPKPSLAQRQQLVRDCSLLHNVDPKQIKVWFQNRRRCREKQRREWTRLQSLNGKLTAINTLLMEENVQLQQHVAHLLSFNHALRHRLSSSSISPTN
ncbi:hypothetical protein L7F22_051693 [Adiantum nelumboides]|nr:hypothetical protein [Adiantum nelumboides]